MLGRRQRGWVQKSLTESAARWNVLAQQTMMGMVDKKAGERRRLFHGLLARLRLRAQRLMEFMRRAARAKPGRAHRRHITPTGSMTCASTIASRRRRSSPRSLSGTSISSGGDGADKLENWEADHWPRTRAFEFSMVSAVTFAARVTPDQWRSDFRVLQRVTRPSAADRDAGIVRD